MNSQRQELPGDEREFVKNAYQSLQQCDSLKKVHKFVNLATKGFQDVWSSWWKGKVPPQLEIDLVLTFEDYYRKEKEIDEWLIIGVEVKYFKEVGGNRNFYEGLEQTLAYGIFGFDGMVLWHIFHPDVSEESVKNYADAMKSIIDVYELPIFYVAGKLVPEQAKIRLEIYKPWQLNQGKGLDYIARCTRGYFREERDKNPFLYQSNVKKRRSIIKTILRIPA